MKRLPAAECEGAILINFEMRRSELCSVPNPTARQTRWKTRR
jgi:hypothetical protein